MCRKVQCLCAGQAPGGSKILLYYDRKLVHTPQADNVCDFNAFFMSFYPGSYDIRSFRSLFYRLWLFYRKPLHQPCVLFGCYLLRLGFVSRPLKSAVIEPLVKQQKSIAFPEQSLDPVAPPSAEQKQSARIYIKLVVLLNYTCKSVDPTAKVGVAADDEIRTFYFFHHDRISRSMTDISSGDIFIGTLISIPFPVI